MVTAVFVLTHIESATDTALLLLVHLGPLVNGASTIDTKS